MSLKPTLDTIPKVSSQKENATSESRDWEELSGRETFEPIDLEEIPKANEELASSIWKAVQERADDDLNGRFTSHFLSWKRTNP